LPQSPGKYVAKTWLSLALAGIAANPLAVRKDGLQLK
jgi:hypothetical protein